MSKRTRGRNNKLDNENGPVFVRHPFSDISPQLLHAALEDKAIEDAERFPELISRIQQIFSAVYPLHLIAVISQYGLMSLVGEYGVLNWKPGNRINQHHIELLLAILLTVEQRFWGHEPADPKHVQEVMDIVVELADAFHFRRFISRKSFSEEQDRTVATLQEKLRLHTQMVRNWSHFSGVVTISRELYAAIDEQISAAHGFSATEAIMALEAAVRFHEWRQDDKFQRLRKVLRERSRGRIGRKLKEHFPEIAGDAIAWIEAMPADWPREAILAEVQNLTDRLSVPISTFGCDELGFRAQIDTSKVELVLRALSLDVDELVGQDPEHLFLENPAWSAPFLKLGDNYFCPVPQAAFSHIHRIMRRLADDAGASSALSDARAKYLEVKITDTIRASLPMAKLTPNAKWKLDGIEYENDLIAVLDQTVLIIEAKSPALTPQGLRGAPKRVQRHVRELVQEPAIQSERLRQEILKAKSGDQAAIKLVEGLGIDPSNTELIFRLSITLDDFSVLSSAELDLKKAGWIEKELSLPPTLNVADFVSVCHILDEPSLVLHYFSERERVQKGNIIADELDFLGFYLRTGFNTTAIANDDIGLVLTDMSSVVDDYYNSLDAGVVTSKPRPKIHEGLLRLIRACQQRAAKGWTVFCVALLGIGDFGEQCNFFKGLERIEKNVRKKFRDPKHDCAVVIQPPDYREHAFVFHVFPNALSNIRNDVMNELAQVAMANQHRQKCIVVSRKLEDRDRPYNCIALFVRPSEDSRTKQ